MIIGQLQERLSDFVHTSSVKALYADDIARVVVGLFVCGHAHDAIETILLGFFVRKIA